MIMPQNVPASCCNFTGSDVLLIKISAKFDVWPFQTFNIILNQMTCECNNSSEIPCTMLLLYRNFFHRISSKFYVNLSATFLNFQYSSRSSYLVNLMTPQYLPALCCNFTRMFFTWNSWNTSIVLNFQTSPRSGCMLNITP